MALSVTSAPWQQVAEPALDLRRQLGAGRTEGVVGLNDLAVAQRAAGANMSVDVSAGEALVAGDSITNQGLYYVYNDAALNVTGFTAANATNPRIDRVVLRIQDAFHGDAANSVSFEILTGTATAGATLTNLNGVAAVGNGRLLLANILVPATATTITTANIDTTGEFSEAVLVRPRSQNPAAMSVIRDRVLTVAAGGIAFGSSIPIPTNYRSLRLVYYLRGTAAAGSVNVQITMNNDASTVYYSTQMQNTDIAASTTTGGTLATSSLSSGYAPAATATSGHYSAGWVEIPFYNYGQAHALTFACWGLQGGATGQIAYRAGGGTYAVSAAITRLNIFPSSGNWDIGSGITLYGLP